MPESTRAFEHTRRDPVGESIGRHEVGESVAARLAMPLDLLPVDVDVGQIPLVEAPRRNSSGSSCRSARSSIVSGLKTVL